VGAVDKTQSRPLSACIAAEQTVTCAPTFQECTACSIHDHVVYHLARPLVCGRSIVGRDDARFHWSSCMDQALGAGDDISMAR